MNIHHLQHLLKLKAELEDIQQKNNIIKDINPEEPFYKDYTNNYLFNIHTEEYKEDINKYENFYQKINTPMTEKEYQKEFAEYINKENFYSNNKNIILEKIWEDSFFIYQKLKKLNNLGLTYTLDLTGGAVRDFILGKEKEIKDLDFMISIKTNDGDFCINKEKIQTLLPQENAEELLYNQELFYKKLIESCFQNDIKKSFLNTSSYNFNSDKTSIREKLIGVIKFKKQNYNMDLLITNAHKVKFLSSFDFNLCKTSFSLIGFYHQNFPQKPEHFISRFSGDVSFFADIKNKKLTMFLDDFKEKEIIHSLNNHYLRLQKKYPDYKINLVFRNNNISEENLNKKRLAENIINYHYLHKNIKKNSSSIIRKKI